MTGSVSHIEAIYSRHANKIKEAWEKHVRDNFAGQGSEVGGWSSLSSYTIEKRINMGFSPGPILDMTGQLKTSWVVDVAVSRGEVRASLMFPSSLPSIDGGMEDIARKQHLGTGNIPARPLFDEEVLSEIFYSIIHEIEADIVMEVL